MKNKSYIKYISVIFIVLIFSLSLPSILQKFDESKLLGTHKLEKIDLNMSSEAKDIPLVQRIHDIYNGIYSSDELEITSVLQTRATSEEYQLIVKQLKELIDKNIILNINYDYLLELSEAIYTKIIYSSSVQNLKEYELSYKEQTISLWWDIENRKIISIKVNGDGEVKINNEKEIVLNGYLDYLNLDLLGDWSRENDTIQSKKSSLEINLEIQSELKEQCLFVTPTLIKNQ